MKKFVYQSVFSLFLSLVGLHQNSYALPAANDDHIPKREVFILDFNLLAPKGGNILFVDGYPTPQSYDHEDRSKDYYRTLQISASARVRYLGALLLRFTFVEPLKIKTRNIEGRDGVILYRSIDVKLSRQAMREFRWLQSIDSDSVIIGRSTPFDDYQAFEEVLNQTPTESVRKSMEVQRKLAPIYFYQGRLRLGFVKFEKMNSEEVYLDRIHRMDLRAFSGFDPSKYSLSLDLNSYSIPLETIASLIRSSTSDPRVHQYLRVKEYVDDAVERSRPFLLGRKMIDGQESLVIYSPDQQRGILYPEFSHSVKSCEFIFM